MSGHLGLHVQQHATQEQEEALDYVLSLNLEESAALDKVESNLFFIFNAMLS